MTSSKCYDWSIAHPGPLSARVFPGTVNEHYNDNANPEARSMYKELARKGPFGAFLADLWGSEHVWLFAEEIFAKEGGRVGRSPWHQDSSYVPFGGEHWVNCWISFEAIPKECSIEVVRGSHRETLYDGTSYDDYDDPTKPLWGDGSLPRLPDIEAERAADPDSWNVLSWGGAPGDVILLHPSGLHGGGPLYAESCPERHTLVLRFFGDDAYYRPLPQRTGAESLFYPTVGSAGDRYADLGFTQVL